MVNGISELAMMKADVLNDFGTIRVCTGYRVNGSLTDRMPYTLTDDVEAVYEDLPGWGDTAAGIPAELEAYILRIENAVGVPVKLVSTGPDRAQTILRAPGVTA